MADSKAGSRIEAGMAVGETKHRLLEAEPPGGVADDEEAYPRAWASVHGSGMDDKWKDCDDECLRIK